MTEFIDWKQKAADTLRADHDWQRDTLERLWGDEP